MSNNVKNVRLSNYELLRILSMILITMHHYAYHGGFEFWYYVPFNRVLVQFLALGGKLGVNCFVLISGYFLSTNTKGIHWKGMLKFVLQVTVFSLGIQTAGWITGLAHFSPENLLRACFPLLYWEWWFASVYFILLFLSPYLNKAMHAIDQKTHLYCIVTLICIWSVIPTVIGAYMESNNLTWFITLYILAGYIRKYNTSFFTNRKLQVALLGISTGLILLLVLGQDFVGYQMKINMTLDDIPYVSQMWNPLLTVQSVSLFCVFHNLPIKPSKTINTIASAMFGVYLIHDSNLLRPYLWLTLFENKAYQYSPYLFAHAAGAIAAVFAVCTVLSLLYNLTIGKWADPLYRRGQKAAARWKGLLISKWLAAKLSPICHSIIE